VFDGGDVVGNGGFGFIPEASKVNNFSVNLYPASPDFVGFVPRYPLEPAGAVGVVAAVPCILLVCGRPDILAPVIKTVAILMVNLDIRPYPQYFAVQQPATRRAGIDPFSFPFWIDE
jgi:hypothetical protein